MKNSFKITLVICLFLWVTTMKAQTLHAFVVSDDTDPLIGAVVDAPYMEAQMRKIAEQSGLTLSLKTFKKSQTSAATMTAAVKDLNCSPTDAVFFYYTGHGANAPNSNFSLFVFDRTRYTMDWVESKIKEKNPRLFIILYDACNYIATPVNGNEQLVARNPVLKLQNYQKLFKDASGTIKIASNTKGDKYWSYGDEVTGGVFTRVFANVLEAAVTGNATDCTWENIKNASINATVERTTGIKLRISNEIGPIQTPYYELNVQYKRGVPDQLGHTETKIEEVINAQDPK